MGLRIRRSLSFHRISSRDLTQWPSGCCARMAVSEGVERAAEPRDVMIDAAVVADVDVPGDVS